MYTEQQKLSFKNQPDNNKKQHKTRENILFVQLECLDSNMKSEFPLVFLTNLSVNSDFDACRDTSTFKNKATKANDQRR